MRMITLVFCLLFLLTGTMNAQERLKRSESFFGIHFDFHAGPDCTEIGKNTTPEMIHAIIDLVQPDYIQTDCKGVPGYTSYPTKLGNQVPAGYFGDPLRVWREVTAERGVVLVMHYGGVWDSLAIAQNPDWAAIDGAGNRNPNMTSVFSSYVDKLLIPQLKELAGEYQVDGIWVDGECWATMPDYGERSQKLFRETTGIDTIPYGPNDPHWFEWMQFHREAFRNYLRHYVAAVRSEYPEFQICSNWAFTDMMPEPVSAAVDFLSCDLYPTLDNLNSARYSGRFLVHQGVPWDLAAWSFSHPTPLQQKPAVQLKREAAIAFALGGGFQAYFTQNRDGSVRLNELEVMAEVAKFARERQPYCFRSIQIPQVAVLYSAEAFQRNSPGLFVRYGDEKLRGVLQCLLELQYSVDIVTEHTLGRDLERFPMIVVPEWNYLQPTFRDDLVRYVENGGKLFVIGEETTKLFTGAFGDTIVEDGLHVKTTYGKGITAFLPRPIGVEYAQTGSEEIRNIVGAAARMLFPEPLVEVTGSQWVDVSLSKLGDKRMVHLVNTSGNHREMQIIEEIEPVGPLEVVLRCDTKPERITLQPEGKVCDFAFADGKATLTVDSVPIYSILVVE